MKQLLLVFGLALGLAGGVPFLHGQTPVIWKNLSQTNAVGNKIFKTGGNGWNGTGHSLQKIYVGVGGNVEFTLQGSTSASMWGLNDVNTTTSYTDINYAFYTFWGKLYLLENGLHVKNGSAVDVAGLTGNDRLRMEVSPSGQVKYFHNGNLIYTSTQTATVDMFVDSSIYYTDMSIKADIETPITWTNLANTSVSGNKITKTGSNGWNGTGHSVEEIRNGMGGSIEFTIQNSTSSSMWGLNDVNTTASYTDINYAFYTNWGKLYLLENGSHVKNGSAVDVHGIKSNDKLKLAVSPEGLVEYYYNGSLIHTSSQPVYSDLFFDSSIYYTNMSMKVVMETPSFDQSIAFDIAGLKDSSYGTCADGDCGHLDLDYSWNGFPYPGTISCSGLFFNGHTQHVARLPDRGGPAYFVEVSSDDNGGWFWITEIDSQWVGADRVSFIDNPSGVEGKVVFLGRTSGSNVDSTYYSLTSDPDEAFNHPSSVSVVGSTMMIFAGNWQKGCPFQKRPYRWSGRPNHGAILVYDVSDPTYPEFVHLISNCDLGNCDDGSQDFVDGGWAVQYPDKSGYLVKAYMEDPGDKVTKYYKLPTMQSPFSDWTYLDWNRQAGQDTAALNFNGSTVEIVIPGAGETVAFGYCHIGIKVRPFSLADFTYDGNINLGSNISFEDLVDCNGFIGAGQDGFFVAPNGKSLWIYPDERPSRPHLNLWWQK